MVDWLFVFAFERMRYLLVLSQIGPPPRVAELYQSSRCHLTVEKFRYMPKIAMNLNVHQLNLMAFTACCYLHAVR